MEKNTGNNSLSESEKTLQLGGDIKLSGFSNLDQGSFTIIKKLVGNHTKKISERCSNFQGLEISMKPIHGQTSAYELHARLKDNGSTKVARITDHNLFISLTQVLKKIENQLE